jgi:hypothetical protein
LLLLTLFLLGLTGCGHTEAAPAAVAMEVVMQTIRDYGRGHQGTPAPPVSSLPDATDATYREHVRSLLAEGNYAELESIAQTNRSERGRFLAGNWRNNDFFNAVTWCDNDPDAREADYQHQFEKLKKWQSARPESAAARIALAKLYTDYADFARGSGYADSVSDKQWQQYHTRTALAKEALLGAARLQQRDPHWYSVMQGVAHNESWDKGNARELLDQAIAFEPDYFHFYRNYATYLLPQWYGDPGELQTFAEEVAAKHPEPAGSIFYFQIMASLACYCRQETEQLKNADWPKLQAGYTNLEKVYGLSDLNANRFAEMAFVFGDKPVAREAFTQVIKRSPVVWLTEDSYQGARAWATSPDNGRAR